MTDAQRKLLEAIGASEDDTKPRDRVGALEDHSAEQDAAIDDIILIMAEMIGN